MDDPVDDEDPVGAGRREERAARDQAVAQEQEQTDRIAEALTGEAAPE